MTSADKIHRKANEHEAVFAVASIHGDSVVAFKTVEHLNGCGQTWRQTSLAYTSIKALNDGATGMKKWF